MTEQMAIPITSFRDNRMEIDTAKFGSILDKVGDRPLAVVSVNGPMRTGKSYIIGHFIRYLTSSGKGDWFTKKLHQEFLWKNSAARQTTGILVWSEPFVVKDGSGREIAVLLVDTQGCFDDQTTTHENSLIFVLSCLFSSVLIYNVTKQLSEDQLQFLQLFIGYAKMSNAEQQPEDDTFSKLILLIRDWHSPNDFAFGYHDNDTCPGLKNFKRENFDVNAGMAPEVRIAHQEITSSFETVGCCLMPYPGGDLAYYDKVENLEPFFVNAIRDFVPRVFDGTNVITKKIGGHELTGHDMKKIMYGWAKLFREMNIPPVCGVAESTAEVQNNIAYSIALKYYENEMQIVKSGNGHPRGVFGRIAQALQGMTSGEGLTDAAFQELHKRHQEEALNIFKRMKRLRNNEIQEKYNAALDQAIQKACEMFEEINRSLRRFTELKTESVKERQQLKEEMDQRITKMEQMNTRESLFLLAQIAGGFIQGILGDGFEPAMFRGPLKSEFP